MCVEAKKVYMFNSMDVLEETSAITLNAADLLFAVGSINAVDDSGNLYQPKAEILEDKKQERVTFQFENVFKKGIRIKLRVAYEAKLGGSMLGKRHGCLFLNRSGRRTAFSLGYYASSWNKDGKKQCVTI